MLRRNAEELRRIKSERTLDERINALKTSSGIADIMAGIDGVLGTQWRQPFQVGALYVSVSPTNPATTLGYGTWSAFGAGRVLVGVDTGDTDFDTVEETGGSKTATL
jgi:hypothetical protein